ncbi:MAG: SH3 domain-containing protein, partial [Treponema sp.]|nr:SH3 domain-containing protein [Treponema sp.]
MRLIKYIFIIVLFIFSLCGCSKKNIGWGVLLWFTDNPEIPSGTVLSVQIRSGIEQVWVTEIPEAYRSGDNELAMIPLPHLEFFRTKGAAEKFAAAYSEFALLYAETMQDGLPIREKPENNARRSYRLRQGEFIKIIDRVDGVEAISTTGTPLEGNWYKVLTESGSGGYC